MGSSVVVLESDSQVAQSLAGKLSPHFQAVHMARSSDELRDRITKSHPEAVVLDMESSRLTDVRNLRQDFPSLPIVCTHRIPDEQLWVEALEAGANDVCPTGDVENVLASVLQNVGAARAAIA
jgi:DNA-binding response OmpR family regulator